MHSPCARPNRGAAPLTRALHTINSPDDHDFYMFIFIVNPRRSI
jgi:hypothetical protein